MIPAPLSIILLIGIVIFRFHYFFIEMKYIVEVQISFEALLLLKLSFGKVVSFVSWSKMKEETEEYRIFVVNRTSRESFVFLNDRVPFSTTSRVLIWYDFNHSN